MALESQINLYSVDTGNFYSAKERHMHDKNAQIRSERRKIADQIEILKQELMGLGFSEADLDEFVGDDFDITDELVGCETIREYVRLVALKRIKSKAADRVKEKLLTLLSNKIKAKEAVNTAKHPDYQPDIRELNEETISEKNVISLFESSLTRMMGLKKDDFTEDLMVVQVYYFDIFKDMAYYGYMYKGEKYKYYTSSAGQIRKKKAVFIKESVWDKYEKTIMCGLTLDRINELGGNNVNKHLAYMALTNSATDEWSDFNIDRSIVVDDFETNVFGEYDYINDDDYSITRTKGEVLIPHTDGAGMALFGQNRMFRAPWVKGLLGIFDFRSFILEAREKYRDESIGIVKDIYGQEHDVIAENIYVIFTKSQFKMYKYYSSWDEYKDNFKKYDCKAGVCNVEERYIPNTRINYQELQTLTDMTDEELVHIAQKSVDKLNNLRSSVENMQALFGVTAYNRNLSPLQEAVKFYPDIMNDTFFKENIKSIKDSLICKYRAGKLEINGKYTFILPDFYAACQYWFLGIENPVGLLADKEVFCWMFRKHEKLDCLRSPHLYKEHAVRNNVANAKDEERVKELRKWFTTNAVYISTHDLISRILQCDFDGDKSLVIADEYFVNIAERNMAGIVPLYYNMRKAKPTELNSVNIYKGLNAAFTGSNIGIYSNNITKIWNSDIFIGESEVEKQNAVNVVKLLCMENNFTID
jgi:hypothetical protein